MNCPTYPYNVDLFLPKFGIDTKASIVPVLQAMGMTDAPTPSRADFSGITGGRDMFIAKVIHQANIDVDEKGTDRRRRDRRRRRHDRRLRTRDAAQDQGRCASTTRSCS